MLLLLGGALVLLFLIFILMEPYRMERLMSHMSGNTDAEGSSYQILQAKEALLAGGIFGRSAFASNQPMSLTPHFVVHSGNSTFLAGRAATRRRTRQKNHFAQARRPCFHGTRCDTPDLPANSERCSTYQS